MRKIEGIVIHGLGNGKKVGMPTANLNIKDIKEDIEYGVYASRIIIENKSYLGVCNVGNRPTVDNNKTIEVTIIDFNKDIYGKTITIYLLKKLRDIKKFNDLKEVKKQVDIDIKKTKELFGGTMEDNKLLKTIEKNARFSIADLAMMLNEDEDVVNEKLHELEEKKVICGYHTIINYDKTNSEEVTAVIEVGCTPRRDSGYDEIAKEIYSFSEVSTMYLMSGKSEFIVIIKGKTMKEVANFVAFHLAPINGVSRTETYFVLQKYKVEGIVINQENKKDDRLTVKL